MPGFQIITSTNYNGDPCDIYNNIFLNPQFVNASQYDFHIQSYSPCIDAGDPTLPYDPDNTIADIGAYCCIQGPPPTMAVTLTPENPPISIPASGGSFDFNIEIDNLEPTPATFDVWTDVTMPDGSTYGPIINVQGLTLPANTSADRDKTQAVPAVAPSGSYFYNAFVGNYPNSIYASDSFSFTKECDGDNFGTTVWKWSCWGETFDEICGEYEDSPINFILLSAYPNPFNPQTTLSLNLPKNGNISLKIYDLRGREVMNLMEGWYSAGLYENIFDGENLASGTYFARLVTDAQTKTLKLLLIK